MSISSSLAQLNKIPNFTKFQALEFHFFSQITKLIKLMLGNRVNNIQEQKPIKKID